MCCEDNQLELFNTGGDSGTAQSGECDQEGEHGEYNSPQSTTPDRAVLPSFSDFTQQRCDRCRLLYELSKTIRDNDANGD